MMPSCQLSVDAAQACPSARRPQPFAMVLKLPFRAPKLRCKQRVASTPTALSCRTRSLEISPFSSEIGPESPVRTGPTNFWICTTLTLTPREGLLQGNKSGETAESVSRKACAKGLTFTSRSLKSSALLRLKPSFLLRNQGGAVTPTARKGKKELNKGHLLDHGSAIACTASGPVRRFRSSHCASLAKFWIGRKRFLSDQATTTTNCRPPSSRRQEAIEVVPTPCEIQCPPRPVQTGGGRSVTPLFHSARVFGSPAPHRVARSPVTFLVTTLRWPPVRCAARPVFLWAQHIGKAASWCRLEVSPTAPGVS